MIKIALFVLLLFPPLLLAESGALENVTFTPEQNAYNILLKGKGKLNYKVNVLVDPPRVVVDFVDVMNKLSSRNIQPKENPFVAAIRSSENSSSGQPITRLVVDLKRRVDYSVSPVTDGFTLRLTPPKSEASSPTASVPTPPTEPADLRIGSEDLIDVSVFELPQFSVSARVGGDGTITMPLIGTVNVGGLTKKEAEEKIASALEAKYVNNANVSLSIKEYKSKQVSLLGGVGNPGAYYILSNRTLLQLLSEAGGLTPDAGRKCFIFRQGGEKLEIDLNDLLSSGNEKLNVAIFPGDVINIPIKSNVIVYVLGAVRTPGAVELSSEMPVTLLAAIAKAGGMSEQADKSGVKIRRKDDNGKELLLEANVKDILNGKKADVMLQSGDVVNVPESFF